MSLVIDGETAGRQSATLPTADRRHLAEQRPLLLLCPLICSMFDSLRKKLKDSIGKLTRKAEGQPEAAAREDRPGRPLPAEEQGAGPAQQPEEERPEAIERPQEIPETQDRRPARRPPRQEIRQERPIDQPAAGEQIAPPPAKQGLFRRMTQKIRERQLSGSDIDEFFADTELDLLQANMAVEAVDFLKSSLKRSLVSTAAARGKTGEVITRAFEEGLFRLLDQGEIDIDELVKRKRPSCWIFLGFNGAGKTTTIAKVAAYLIQHRYRPLIAAGDTFRAASIEQLDVHGTRLGVPVIRHQYGADSAAVIFDAKKHAERTGYDVVLADTAGRVHTDRNLMDELEKIVRVNKPDLKVLVVDSLTGNDAVEQAKQFNEKVGVDAVVLTKTDINTRGGSIFSVCYAIRKPILFLGTGQEYDKLEKFEPRTFVQELLR